MRNVGCGGLILGWLTSTWALRGSVYRHLQSTLPLRGIAEVAEFLVVFVAARHFTPLSVVSVEGPSMEPTLVKGDRLLVWGGRVRGVHHPQLALAGRIVVFRLGWNQPVLCKRVVAPATPRAAPTDFAGDAPPACSLEVRCSTADAAEDDVTAFAIHRWGGAGRPGDATGNVLWLLGDNPANSRDSRSFGFVPLGCVDGVVLARLWPAPGLL